MKTIEAPGKLLGLRANRQTTYLEKMYKYLYRGVNRGLHERNGGRLRPREVGVPFKRAIYWGPGGGFHWGDGSVFGKSERNAVVQHQKHSSRYPTPGVSTTPFFQRAVKYATHGGLSGYVYKIDVELFERYGVQHYVVSEHAKKPTEPDDQEIILVATDNGPMPAEIVVDVIEVNPHNDQPDSVRDTSGSLE